MHAFRYCKGTGRAARHLYPKAAQKTRSRRRRRLQAPTLSVLFATRPPTTFARLSSIAQLSAVVTYGDFSIYVLFLPTEPRSIRSRMHCLSCSVCRTAYASSRRVARACRLYPVRYSLYARAHSSAFYRLVHSRRTGVCVRCYASVYCACARAWFGRGGRSAWDATVLAAHLQ